MTDRLPLFPLGTVLFPGLVLPLTVFEERYVAMLRDLLALPEEERRFGVVALRPGASEVGRLRGDPARAVHPLGCVAQVVSVEQVGDDRYELMTTGARRFRLLSVDTSLPYLTGEVEELPEPPGGDALAAREAAVAAFTEYQRRLLAAQGRPEGGRLPELPDDPVVMSYLVAAAMILPTDDKQRLLAAEDATLRLAREIRLLRREARLLAHTRTLPALDLLQRPADPN